jgi:RNA recognition motif-containing protein
LINSCVWMVSNLSMLFCIVSHLRIYSYRSILQVTGAKVVTSARNPGSKCYGLVTLASLEDAENCIKQLNKTEFNGRIISLEKVGPLTGCDYMLMLKICIRIDIFTDFVADNSATVSLEVN